jgi:hypothetical protein
LEKVQRRHVPRGAEVVCGAAVERGENTEVAATARYPRRFTLPGTFAVP